MKQILKKSFSKNLRLLDFSDLSNFRILSEKGILKFVIEQCPKLEYLDISNMSVSNLCMREIYALKNLKTLKFARFTRITDAVVTKIFNNCKKIETDY